MSKVFGNLVATVVIAAIAMLGAYAGLRALFPAQRLKMAVQTHIRNCYHREAEVSGVRFGLWSFEVKDLAISEHPDFSAGTLLTARALQIRWKIIPLLRHQIFLKEIKLDSPSVEIHRRPDGALNVSDFLFVTTSAVASVMKSSSAASLSAAQSALQTFESEEPWTWKISRIELRNGMIRFDAGDAMSIREIEADIQDLAVARSKGRLTLGTIESPQYRQRDVNIQWNADHYVPDWTQMMGQFKIQGGAGILQAVPKATTPVGANYFWSRALSLLQKLSSQGLLIGLHDLENLSLDRLNGEYRFQDGRMDIAAMQIDGPRFTTRASGTVALRSRELDLKLAIPRFETAHNGTLQSDVLVKGTIDSPQATIEHLEVKGFRANLGKFMNDTNN